MGIQGVEFGAETTALWSSCANCELRRDPAVHPHLLWSISEKSRIHLQVGVGTPRSVSFSISFPGRIVLKAEL